MDVVLVLYLFVNIMLDLLKLLREMGWGVKEVIPEVKSKNNHGGVEVIMIRNSIVGGFPLSFR